MTANRWDPAKYLAELAAMPHDEFCNHLLGVMPNGARYKPEPLSAEAARRIAALQARVAELEAAP